MLVAGVFLLSWMVSRLNVEGAGDE